jgi:hypothetical protein
LTASGFTAEEMGDTKQRLALNRFAIIFEDGMPIHP